MVPDQYLSGIDLQESVHVGVGTGILSNKVKLELTSRVTQFDVKLLHNHGIDIYIFSFSSSVYIGC
jgi:hypothetical protein